MLYAFGLCLRRSLPEEVHHPGRFLVDDGAGHAFAFYVGSYVIITFQSGIAQLMTTTALDSLIDSAKLGIKRIFGIYPLDLRHYPLDSRSPFQEGSWTPPWSQQSEQDSLCGGGQAQHGHGFQNLCMLEMFWNAGLPVEATRGGPFNADQGNEMLEPFSVRLVLLKHSIKLRDGMYAVLQYRHWFLIIFREGCVLKKDCDQTESKSLSYLSEILQAKDTFIFAFRPIGQAVPKDRKRGPHIGMSIPGGTTSKQIFPTHLKTCTAPNCGGSLKLNHDIPAVCIGLGGTRKCIHRTM